VATYQVVKLVDPKSSANAGARFLLATDWYVGVLIAGGAAIDSVYTSLVVLPVWGIRQFIKYPMYFHDSCLFAS